ncbi:MAG: WD40 repeat domain-containing protein, partial [Candidatus Poseidoniaceae archaeon]
MSKPILLAALIVTVIMLPFAYASDGDGDGISDSLDVCPFAEGYANSTSGNGCPDSDGDGLADFEQSNYQDWNEAGSMQISKGTTDGSVNAVAWAKNNSVFFAGSNSNNVSVYDDEGIFIKHLYSMQGDITDIEISPDGTRLVVGSKNGGCSIINATNGNLVVDLWNGTTSGDIYEVGWSRDDTRIFCGGFNSILKSYYTSNYSFEKNFPQMPGWISGIDTTPDGRIVFVSHNTNVYAYWTNNESQYLNMTNHSNYVRVLTVSPDGRYLATGSHDSTVIITEISTKSIIKTLSFDSQVYDIDFSSDGGSMLVAIGWRTSFSVFRTDTWSTIGTIEGFGTSNGNRGV